MWRHLRLLHLPFWRQLPHQALLPALGIGLGVAAVLAIDLGSASTVDSFSRTREQIDGRTTHQLVAPGGELDGRLAWELVREPGVEAAAPVVERLALGPEPLRILGIDPFAEAGVRALGLEELGEGTSGQFLSFLSAPGALVVSQGYLARNGLAVGDSLELAVGSLRRQAWVVAAMPAEVDGIRLPGDLAVGDIATVQELAGEAGVDRIDLVLEGEGAVAAVRSRLPAGVELREPGGRARYLGTMLGALRTNLAALSYLALFVSLFLIYNALLLAVLRRRRQVGIARCLGATRGEVLGAWLAEAALIGVLGTALGLVLGTLGGRATMAGIAQSASDLYGYVRAEQLALLPSAYLKAAVVGLVASLVAAAFPALEAARTTPVHTARRGEQEDTALRRSRRLPWLALPLLAAGAGALAWPSTSPVPGYVAAIALALAVAALVPQLSSVLLRQLRRLSTRLGAVVPALAAHNIRSNMSRSGVALAALTVALGMSIAMGTMVSSFRAELVRYIGESVRADLYISPATVEVEREAARLDPGVRAAIEGWTGVEAIDSYRGRSATVDGVPTSVAGVQVEAFRRRAGITVLDGPGGDRALDRVEAGEALLAEVLARKLGAAAGDSITVEAAGRARSFRVAAVYREYSTDRGVVLLDRSGFEEAFGPMEPQGLALYLAPGTDPGQVLERIRRELGGRYALLVRSNAELRQQALEVFDRTFAIARSLELIGIAVAAIGILAALLAMLMERARELATLRALGLRPRQLSALLLTEGAMMAGISWLLAVGLGSALAFLLLRVINLRSFGWLLPFQADYGGWLANLGFGLLAALLATLYPLWHSRRLALATALREE